MAKSAIPLLLLLLAVFLHHAAATGRKVGGRVQVKNVEDNKDVQELGRYCVREYNRRKANGSSTTNTSALVFSRVVEAETQVVSGIKYYLKISAASGGAPKTFEAVVVVKPWLHSKDLLDFAPSQLHLTTSAKPDRSYWKFEENGRYSVKSGYLAEIGYYDPPEYSAEHNKKFWNATVWFLKIPLAEIGYYDPPEYSAEHNKKFWNATVWFLKIPPKVKFFLWRAFKNFIPVEANLLRHHVPAKGLCYHCGKFVATTEHCLIFCERIRSTWKESRFWRILKNHKSRSFLEIGEILHKKLSVEDFEIWVILLWMVWKYMCKAKHNKDERQDLVSEEQGVLFWKIAQEARSYLKPKPLMGIQPGEHRWRKPENGTLRMDVDAMFNPTRKKYGIGIIVRDARCEIVAAMAMPITAMGTVMRAEIMAILQGITFCYEEKIGPLVIYTDSLLAVRAMRGMDAGFDLLPEDLQEMVLSTKKEKVIGVFHAYRSATLAAHNLAQFTAQISDRVVWKSDFPAWLVNVVSNDIE